MHHDVSSVDCRLLRALAHKISIGVEPEEVVKPGAEGRTAIIPKFHARKCDFMTAELIKLLPEFMFYTFAMSRNAHHLSGINSRPSPAECPNGSPMGE
jgi:hypothetical protein